MDYNGACTVFIERLAPDKKVRKCKNVYSVLHTLKVNKTYPNWGIQARSKTIYTFLGAFYCNLWLFIVMFVLCFSVVYYILMVHTYKKEEFRFSNKFNDIFNFNLFHQFLNLYKKQQKRMKSYCNNHFKCKCFLYNYVGNSVYFSFAKVYKKISTWIVTVYFWFLSPYKLGNGPLSYV